MMGQNELFNVRNPTQVLHGAGAQDDPVTLGAVQLAVRVQPPQRRRRRRQTFLSGFLALRVERCKFE